jgi:hypothetical protein
MNKFGVAYKIVKVPKFESPLGSRPESPGLLANVLHKISTLGDWAVDKKPPHDGQEPIDSWMYNKQYAA